MENGNIVAYLERNPDAPRKPFVCPSFFGLRYPSLKYGLSKIYDIASGLEYLHAEHIVHGDLKGVRLTFENYLSINVLTSCIA